MKNSFESESIFRLWDYNVSLDTMLIRSNNDEGNVDLVFWGVYFLQSKTMFKGIKIQEATIKDYELVKNYTANKNEKLYVLESEKEFFFIGALGLSIHTNNLEFHVSTIRGTNPGEIVMTL